MNFYTYNGEEQVGVDAGEGYTLSGDYRATNAGNYTAKVNLLEGYEWQDGSTDEKRLNGKFVQLSKIRQVVYRV